MSQDNIFELASNCLQSASIEEKVKITRCAYSRMESNQIDFTSRSDVLPISETVFPEFPELVDPKNLPRRGLGSDSGRIALLHSLAHIEFYAIHLAWDILYRFRGLPIQFYKDWLRVAAEESLHFTLLRRRLNQLESDYGKLAAHSGLWDIASETTEDILARLALVPRTMEARGLDVTPGMIEKVLKVGDKDSAEILKRILKDEVGHVAIGSYWFKFICKERQLDSQTTYIELVKRFLKGKIRRPINHALRKQAGFDERELTMLESLQ